MLKAGIVGLPNVGKSTLFNAVIRSHKAEAANYPFCTIEPNMGMVTVPDPRLESLTPIFKTKVIVPTVLELVDIAGLVKGAAKGEGLGNKFLSHIREVDAIIQVVRCFEDPNVHHVAGAIDPVRDIETVGTKEKLDKDAKHGDKTALAELEVLKKVSEHLNTGKPANTLTCSREEKTVIKGFFLLTAKPTIFAANVKDTDLAGANTNPFIVSVREYARTHHDCETTVNCAQLESDLIDLSTDEAKEYLHELGVAESGVDALIRSTYHVLGLRTFFTGNEKEVRAWTVHAGDTAPTAAGIIHTDFERGFIKAETVSHSDLVRCGSIAGAREKGLCRMEGKDYVVQDGDVIHFKFNV
ncbi:MAG: redox-regulated ATPase YchF [Candidatus Omnitrophica bacterium]|nr:redox-regulated ATPase YchF [Candidatus Omnitrophota bacterium]